MPTYDYFCEANGRKIEVSHKIAEVLTTWQELAACAGIDPGGTPADAPVKKLISSAAVVNSASLSNPEPPCAAGGRCPGGRCGI